MSSHAGSRSSGWTGWVLLAGIVLLIIGFMDIIEGLVALFKKTVYVVPSQSLVVTTSYTTWGWALLIWGIVAVLAGVGLWSAKSWARWFAMVVVVINIIGLFTWLPAFPLWNIVVIALNVIVLLALTLHWSEVRADLRGR